MVMLWYALVLAPFIAIPIFWWSYQRKQAARERLANERWQSVVRGVAEVGPSASAAANPVSSPRQSAQSLAHAPVMAFAFNGLRRRERILDPAETLAFYLLRSGLPDCEVLVRVRLDHLVTVTDAATVSPQGLAQHTFDFVICNKTMQALAAVDVLDREAGATLTAAPDFKTQCLAQSGVRYVRVLRSALPKRQDVRALVLGPDAAD